MASLANLYGTAEQILQLFTAQLKDLGVSLPDRQAVLPGQVPVWDGDQVTVNLMGVAPGQPGLGGPPTLAPSVTMHAQYGVSLVRAIPVMQSDGPFEMMIPDETQVNASSAEVLGDAASLLRAAANIYLGNLLVAPGERMDYLLRTLGPEGGLAAHQLVLTLNVD